MQENKSQNAILVIDRLKSLLKIRTDIELSEFLNIKPNTISTWKKRDSLDHASIIAICELYELDLNEVFLNKKAHGDYATETPLLSREVQFQYVAGTDREALLEVLPTYHFPFIMGEHSMAFQVVSSNMFPLLEENAFVICEKADQATIPDNSIAVIVSKQKGIFINRVAKSTYKPDVFVLSNESDFYNDVTIKASEITEIWLVSAVLSYDFNNTNKFKFISDSLKKINTFMDGKKVKH